MYELFSDEVFPLIKGLGGAADAENATAYAKYMKDAVFVIPTPSLLERVVTMISAIPMDDRDTKGDLYEYLLSHLQHQGRNGQFRTPRHIIRMMVELLDSQPTDGIADPVCGTCGFFGRGG